MDKNAIYLKHIKVIRDNPRGLLGKTISEMFDIDRHSFFFKDPKGQIYYYTSFLNDREILPGLSLDQNPQISYSKENERLYLYPSVYDKNIFDEFIRLQGWRDSTDKRYDWIKGAFELGVFNDKIRSDYLSKLKIEYREYLKRQLEQAEKNLESAKEALAKV
jgi:hypothetical protein